MHISRISRENEKWFCEIFLARNPAREIARKMSQILANLRPNLTKIWAIFKTRLPLCKQWVLYHSNIILCKASDTIQHYLEKKIWRDLPSRIKSSEKCNFNNGYTISNWVGVELLESCLNIGQIEPLFGQKRVYLISRISRNFSREMGHFFSHLARNQKREKCACLVTVNSQIQSALEYNPHM